MSLPEDLNITLFNEAVPENHTYYMIQAFKDGKWHDVIYTKADEKGARKKARYIRNQSNCDIRLIRISEYQLYAYDYEIVQDDNNQNYPELTIIQGNSI